MIKDKNIRKTLICAKAFLMGDVILKIKIFNIEMTIKLIKFIHPVKETTGNSAHPWLGF